MLDFPAMPIAIGLTLWDALPIFLCLGLALAVLARSLLHGQSFHRYWQLRDTAGIEGILYTLVFLPGLLPVVIICSVVFTSSRLLKPVLDEDLPVNSLKALRQRLEELFFAVLVASALAGVLKTAAPEIPDSLVLQSLIATAAGLVSGNRSGVAVIPAIAIAFHLGGLLPAALCMLVATCRHIILDLGRGRR